MAFSFAFRFVFSIAFSFAFSFAASEKRKTLIGVALGSLTMILFIDNDFIT